MLAPRWVACALSSADRRKKPALYAETEVGVATAASQARRKKPQVLAPAGGWAQLRAAVACGADAVYFGLDGVNARARAENFTLQELPGLMAELHAAGALCRRGMSFFAWSDCVPLARHSFQE